MTRPFRALLALMLGVVLVASGCSAQRGDQLDPGTLTREVERLAQLVGSTQIVSIIASHELVMVRFAKNGQQVEARAWNDQVLEPTVLDPLNKPVPLASLDLKTILDTALGGTTPCVDPELIIKASGPGQGYYRLNCQSDVRQLWWLSDNTPIAFNVNTQAGIAEALSRAAVGVETVTKVSIGSDELASALSVFSAGQDWGTRITVRDGRPPSIDDYGHDGPAFPVSKLDPQRIHACAAQLMLVGGTDTWFVDIYARADGQILLVFDLLGWHPTTEGTALNQDCQEIPR